MIVAENHAPVIAATRNVIKSIGVRNSQWPRHNWLTINLADYRSQDLTPNFMESESRTDQRGNFLGQAARSARRRGDREQEVVELN
jgi:hypothetical protein